MLSSEFRELEQRIANWRRFYQESLKFACVPYYTPPSTGNTINDEIAVMRMTPEIQAAFEKSIAQRKDQLSLAPIHIRDAELLEFTWQRLPDPAKKTYIKLEKIDQMSRTEKGCFILWRKMHAFGVRINNFEAHEAYDLATLEYFARKLRLA